MITENQLNSVVNTLVDMAMKGNLDAIKLVITLSNKKCRTNSSGWEDYNVYNNLEKLLRGEFNE